MAGLALPPDNQDHIEPGRSAPEEGCPELCEVTKEGREIRLEAIAEKVYQSVRADLLGRHPVGASCRIEIGANFTLLAVRDALDYLAALGVRTVYLSPFAVPRPAKINLHPKGTNLCSEESEESEESNLCQPAYHAISRRVLNPRLGGREALPKELDAAHRPYIAMDLLLRDLEQRGMTCIFDLVPNHMAFGEKAHGNRIAWSVLKYGQESPFREFFYLNFEGHPDKKIVLPFLGEALGPALDQGKVRLGYDKQRVGFCIELHNHTRLPVAPASYACVLTAGQESAEAAFLEQCLEQDAALGRALDRQGPAERIRIARERCEPFRLFTEVLDLCQGLERCSNAGKQGQVRPAVPGEDLSFKEALRSIHLGQRVFEIERRLKVLQGIDVFEGYLERCLRAFDRKAPGLQSVVRLWKLLQAQPYQLVGWSHNQKNLNYMRFFEVSELIRTNMMDRSAFREANGLAVRLAAKYRCVAGMRIDHPGGLREPGIYLHDLQRQIFLSCGRRVFRRMPFKPLTAACGRTRRNPGQITWKEISREVARRWEETPKEETVRLLVRLETVLGPGERQPRLEDKQKRCWHDGGVGYENRDMIVRLGVDAEGARRLSRVARKFMGHALDLSSDQEKARLREEKKKAADFVIGEQLYSDFRLLAQLIFDHFIKPEAELPFPHFWHEYNVPTLTGFLMDLAKHMPVYRTYLDGASSEAQDADSLKAAFQAVCSQEHKYQEDFLQFMQGLFLANGDEPALPFVGKPEERRNCVATFQAITGPVMAMAVENTELYRVFDVGPLGCLDVGVHFQRGGETVGDFHRYAEQQAMGFPLTATPADTHDLKRSSDVSDRLNALTHDPQMIALFDEYLGRLDAQAGKFCNEDRWREPAKWRYFIYSHAPALWPLELGPNSINDLPEFEGRLANFVWKAINEGKEESSHFDKDDPAQGAKAAALWEFVHKLFTHEECVQTIYEFSRELSPRGARLTLANSTLRHGGFGVPDDRLGSAVFTFCAVDPDNRRPPQVVLCADTLNECRQRWESEADRAQMIEEIRAEPDQHLAKTLFEWRGKTVYTANAEVLQNGAYTPVEVFTDGQKSKAGAIAWIRSSGDTAVLTVADMRGRVQHPGDWLQLPAGLAEARFRNEYTGEVVTAGRMHGKAGLSLDLALQGLPGALLVKVSPD